MATKHHPPPGEKRRDRQATEERLIQAVGSVLARDGFTRLGVNAVAREAGVNNVLIYRYFGGLPGLIRAFGSSRVFWPSLEEIMGCDAVAFRDLPVQERFARAAVNYCRALRQRPLTREILAWELVESNQAIIDLVRIREDMFQQLFELMQPEPEKARPGQDTGQPDALALSAIVGAACNYFAVRSRTVDVFGGLDLNSRSGAGRLEKALRNMALTLFTDPDSSANGLT